MNATRMKPYSDFNNMQERENFHKKFLTISDTHGLSFCLVNMNGVNRMNLPMDLLVILCVYV